jgi:TIR domain
MTVNNDDAPREDTFLGGLVPQVTEHLAEQRAQDFDAGAGQSRFLAWLAVNTREHAAPDRSGVFISYRRSDTGPYARLLQVGLKQRFPGTPVFMDVDSIEAGTDFAEVITSAVQSCMVLIALIGRGWLTAEDEEEGRRRIDDPDDYVRFEIQTALERGVRVIPVLADGAKPPRPQQLPSSLRRLARLNALELSYDRFQYDEARLMAVIEKVLAVENSSATL